MAILSRESILDLIENNEIKIDPFSQQRVGPASVDLTLGNDFRVFKNARKIFDLNEDFQLDSITELVHIEDGEGLMLMPSRSCLGVTVEKITLPDNICGWLQGRSRFARLGLVIHSTASFIQPGVSNHQVLEITNTGQIPINIFPKIALCQVIFEKCTGNSSYEGRFLNQTLP